MRAAPQRNDEGIAIQKVCKECPPPRRKTHYMCTCGEFVCNPTDVDKECYIRHLLTCIDVPTWQQAKDTLAEVKERERGEAALSAKKEKQKKARLARAGGGGGRT